MNGRDLRDKSALCAALASHLRSLVTYADLYRPEALRVRGSRAHSELQLEANVSQLGWGDRPVAASQQDLMLRVAAHLDHLIAYAMRVEHDFVTPFALESIARTAILRRPRRVAAGRPRRSVEGWSVGGTRRGMGLADVREHRGGRRP